MLQELEEQGARVRGQTPQTTFYTRTRVSSEFGEARQPQTHVRETFSLNAFNVHPHKIVMRRSRHVTNMLLVVHSNKVLR